MHRTSCPIPVWLNFHNFQHNYYFFLCHVNLLSLCTEQHNPSLPTSKDSSKLSTLSPVITKCLLALKHLLNRIDPARLLPSPFMCEGVGGCGCKGLRALCVALCHTFQCEENKSICEVATGAECTFTVGACCEWLHVCVCVCVLVCVCVCVCWSLYGDWLAGLCGIWPAWLVSHVITKAWLHTDITINAF